MIIINITKLKFRKFNFLALFVLVLLFSMPKLIQAQGFNGLVGIVQSTNGNWFYYNAYEIKVEKTPTHFITVPIFSAGFFTNLKKEIYKINCETEELQIDDKSWTVKNTDNAADRIVKGLCGFKQGNATWVHYFTFPLDSEKKVTTLFFNIENLEKVFIAVDGVQKEGIKVYYTGAAFNKSTSLFQIANIRDQVISCSEEKLFEKENDVYKTFSFGSGLFGARHNLCNGVYANLVKPNLSAPLVLPKLPSQVVSPKQLSPINNAKAKCIELGFKSGTEELGKCVLQLSK
jgi:hypothetical protein